MDSSLRDCVRRALLEDLGGADTPTAGDLTSRAALPEGQRGKGVIVSRDRGCLAGGEAARECFRALDPAVEVSLVGDGSSLEPGDEVMTVRGDLRAMLAAERTALNFLQHLSGVATATRAMVVAVDGSSPPPTTRRSATGPRR